MIALLCGTKISAVFSFVWSQHACGGQTDGQTDGQNYDPET